MSAVGTQRRKTKGRYVRSWPEWAVRGTAALFGHMAPKLVTSFLMSQRNQPFITARAIFKLSDELAQAALEIMPAQTEHEDQRSLIYLATTLRKNLLEAAKGVLV
jgi:hypothetical protein